MILAAQQISLHKLRSFSCDACKEASKLAEIELESRHMRKRLIHEAKHFVCDRLPQTFKHPCENLTKSYVPLVLSKLNQRLQKGEICEVINFKVYKNESCEITLKFFNYT